jgi:hypothetical protein
MVAGPSEVALESEGAPEGSDQLRRYVRASSSGAARVLGVSESCSLVGDARPCAGVDEHGDSEHHKGAETHILETVSKSRKACTCIRRRRSYSRIVSHDQRSAIVTPAREVGALTLDVRDVVSNIHENGGAGQGAVRNQNLGCECRRCRDPYLCNACGPQLASSIGKLRIRVCDTKGDDVWL